MFNQRQIFNQFQISSAHRRQLNPAPVDPDQGMQLLPISVDDSVLDFKRCYVDLDCNVFTSDAGFQNIDATSTVTLVASFKYFIADGDFAGTWQISYSAAQMSQSLVIVRDGGNNYATVRKLNLLGVLATREEDSEEVADFSKLLLFHGIFLYGFFYDSSAAKSLGAGVTDEEVFLLKGIVNMTLVCLPTYIT